MTDFERNLVNSFNEFFKKKQTPKGIAHRKKQHRFTSQLCDILVDSPDKNFYLAIENKSIKEKSNNKLYFSRHFSEAEGKHQVERISDFVNKSGRKGFLSVELKRGRGKSRKAYMIPWKQVKKRYSGKFKGFELDEFNTFKELEREGSKYKISSLNLQG